MNIFGFAKKTENPFTRKTAMNGKPAQLPAVSKEFRDAKLYVTVDLERPRWQRMLGEEKRCKRSFGLDSYGQEVYGYCDGKNTVKEIIRQFADKHNISIAESETAVATFLQTLMSKGLIGIEIKKSDLKRKR